ncbi:MAG: aldehyde ferredoxin oxidoreductase family protein [Candidatus Cloacimonadota bacterium]|nr:aldehyde ferredoxin oxidoreductase family protein [Candidatus Cloacimonadota bacterium]
MNGWMGKILKINLTTGKQEEIKIADSLLKKYLGGRGLGVKLYTQLCLPSIDPLSPENALIFMTGPVTGTVLTSGRYQVISKSPLTGTICNSSSGGIFGERIKSAGFDGFIITGKAEKPIYLLLTENGFEIKNAKHYWGKNTHETRDGIIRETFTNASVASIGPAGENQVLFAAIMNDKDRTAGRGGMGTIMGSKNLKAIAVHGMEKVAPRYPQKLKKLLTRIDRLVDKNPITGKSLKVLGTSVLVNILNSHGMFPTKNFQSGVFNDAEGTSGEKLQERFVTSKSACYKCPIACGRATATKNKSGEGPEYETMWAFGAQLGNSNLEVIAEANYACNELGLDTISTGNTIGCAMELSELGVLPQNLKWGDSEKIVDIVNDIAYKRGIGEDLALGSKRLSKKYKKPNLSMQVKGMELPAYDPRGAFGQGLSYVTSNRGGCHMQAYMIGPEILGQPVFMDRFSYDGKAEIVALMQNVSAFVDSMILCRFLQFPFGISTFTEILNCVTGYEFTDDELLEVGKRIFTLERDFNVKAGFSRKDDILPQRFLYEQLTEGPSRNQVIELDRMLDEYYSIRGWNSNGIPLQMTIEKLKF